MEPVRRKFVQNQYIMKDASSCWDKGTYKFLFMNVKLVSITKPEITELKTAEELIVYCARVSNPSNQLNTETSSRLLKYLINHKHWSPFEMVNMCVEIKTSRAIAAQILRHRSFSFQEFSQRYSTATELEDIEWRIQGKTNRQVGDDIVDLSPELKDEVDTALATCKELYNKLIEKGLAKECARMVLPLNTSTTIYMSGTIRSWIHYLDIRCKEDTQKEHRIIADNIKGLFKINFPNITEALNW
jgi:thymidylate synthase (FAD)